MSDMMNFQVGDIFPIPITAQGDGGLFQIDANGIMFILQLSNTDVIAREAFRTGAMELAIFEENGVLSLLYRIDGIFKEGWGDAPLALHLVKPELKTKNLTDPMIHLYLVDSKLHTLLALRQIPLDKDSDGGKNFFKKLQQHIEGEQEKPISPVEFNQRLQSLWAKYTPASMREKASAVLEIPMDTDKMKIKNDK